MISVSRAHTHAATCCFFLRSSRISAVNNVRRRASQTPLSLWRMALSGVITGDPRRVFVIFQVVVHQKPSPPRRRGCWPLSVWPPPSDHADFTMELENALFVFDIVGFPCGCPHLSFYPSTTLYQSGLLIESDITARTWAQTAQPNPCVQGEFEFKFQLAHKISDGSYLPLFIWVFVAFYVLCFTVWSR